LEVGEVDEVCQDDEVSCSFNIDPNLTLDSLLSDDNDVKIHEERKLELSRKRKRKIFNVLDISYYIIHILYYILGISYFSILYFILAVSYYTLDRYSLVFVFNRMSKTWKVVSKKLFRRKSKAEPGDTLFRGSTLGSSRRDKILVHIDLTLMGRTVCYQSSEVILIFLYHFAI
jgi:hypothetical protein